MAPPVTTGRRRRVVNNDDDNNSNGMSSIWRTRPWSSYTSGSARGRGRVNVNAAASGDQQQQQQRQVSASDDAQTAGTMARQKEMNEYLRLRQQRLFDDAQWRSVSRDGGGAAAVAARGRGSRSGSDFGSGGTGFSHAAWDGDEASGSASHPLSSDMPSIPTKTNSPQIPGDGQIEDPLQLLLPLLILLTSLLFSLLVFLVFLILVRRRRGAIALPLGEGGPTNLEHEDRWEAEADVAGIEQRWLEDVDENVGIGYTRAKAWQTQYPPNSQPTDITLSQFLSIQEKGISAWSFEPDYESNPALIVQSRTEITFLSDGVGMAPEEGGGCCVQSNLPLPKINEVYYWECKMYDKPEGTNVALGLATKPYPSFRMPGASKYSIGYNSSDGFKSHSYPFTATSYGPPLREGDVLGIGYRPRAGTVFFTRNGKKLEDAYTGLTRHNLFPTVGADGPCTVHVNLGQAGFVFIEANVKKWGLAPAMGTLAPPPAYGSERGSILLESAVAQQQQQQQASRGLLSGFTGGTSGTGPSSRAQSGSRPSGRRHHSSRRNGTGSAESSGSTSGGGHPSTAAGAAAALGSPTRPAQPVRPSPLRRSRNLSHQSSSTHSYDIENGRRSPLAFIEDSEDSAHADPDLDDEERARLHNPPTPGLLDISLHSMHRFPSTPPPRSPSMDDDEVGSTASHSTLNSRSASEEGGGSGGESNQGRIGAYSSSVGVGQGGGTTQDPPAYHPIDPHMYAPGVAETILEDAFANSGGRNGAGAGGANSMGGHGGGGGYFHPSQTYHPTQQGPFFPSRTYTHQSSTAAGAGAGARGSPTPFGQVPMNVGYPGSNANGEGSESGRGVGGGLLTWLGFGSGATSGSGRDVEAGTGSGTGAASDVYPGGQGRRGTPGATR
ncbi:BQ2448_2943 [Microbotryum intermedium]|uniref:BQ2448_2943 protein n=1 Tax=Microbotryum intermedium TaxID=269621 RepID=A0A238FDW2_9BASI|nr:BQ2448_2943 [Microbotryum intermedium]